MPAKFSAIAALIFGRNITPIFGNIYPVKMPNGESMVVLHFQHRCGAGKPAMPAHSSYTLRENTGSDIISDRVNIIKFGSILTGECIVNSEI